MLSPFGSQARRARRRGGDPAHRPGRWTLLLLIAVIASLIPLALVRRDPADASLSPSDLKVVRGKLGASATQASWREVAAGETPIGRYRRVRPWLGEVELRGFEADREVVRRFVSSRAQ
ncbi:MAG: hypothetical protein U0527_13255 [Candidatus Eisenbacteria bacterium]